MKVITKTYFIYSASDLARAESLSEACHSHICLTPVKGKVGER